MYICGIGRYKLGRTLGEGSFVKVKFARNVETNENVAIKILNKEKVLKHKMIGQAMANKMKIYIVMEFVTGGELFDKIPENLLLAANGVLKVSDFGLSALPQQARLNIQVINNKGYNGAKADLWSCGVILFVLMAGYLPFEGSNLMALYKKACKL
ncbi:CBL-interacting kinase 04 [Olea europaea subsp. europaea]|uniref:CBL-interacting kinase 04 n=1 Tax=Olea europaea subsp. europaea TaxID=158383 RepID=A0A8S0PB50_OLEEU|nr:CBL-interacting kinase 04 [Olea europaea subsp. europaea]